MAEFFAMGGYAAYVWPSYGLAAAVMIGLLILSFRELRDNEATLKALENLRPARRPRRDAAQNASPGKFEAGDFGAGDFGGGDFTPGAPRPDPATTQDAPPRDATERRS